MFSTKQAEKTETTANLKELIIHHARKFGGSGKSRRSLVNSTSEPNSTDGFSCNFPAEGAVISFIASFFRTTTRFAVRLGNEIKDQLNTVDQLQGWHTIHRAGTDTGIRYSMIIISAMARNHVIGSGDGMPWDVPEEYQHFLDTVQNQALIIGRKSFDIYGPTLGTTQTFVVTRSHTEFKNATCVNSFDKAVRLAEQTGLDVFVAGGASIYNIAITEADRMLLSYINGDFKGDAYFPEIPESEWQVVSREDRGRYELVDYRRANTVNAP